MKSSDVGFVRSLVGGGAAGLAVDVALFPLDTIKTRLQSEVGFRAAGGLRNIYHGLGPAALGSAPNAAAFFCAYEFTKRKTKPFISEEFEFGSHAIAASFGEVVACLIRVPTEVIKQRRQTSPHSSPLRIVKNCLQHEGMLGLYRGYWSTVVREIPFSFIQYPLWEYFRKCWSLRQGRSSTTALESALSGALAGGIAAALTTPLDVAKTRIMLADRRSRAAKGNITEVLFDIYKKKGIRGLYAGVTPRSLAMALGGAIYFGVYQFTIQTFTFNS